MFTSKSDLTRNVIVLRSVFGKVGQKYSIQPVRKPDGRFPDCVKHVDSNGDMILTDKERNSGDYFIPENEVFVVEDGTTFDLNDPRDAAAWEAIRNCVFIAPSRDAKDASGNSLIDGTLGWDNRTPRYGQAELYVEVPGAEAVQRVRKKDLYRKAMNYIYDDPRGNEGRMLMAKLLGKNMSGVMDADVQDYLLSIAEADPAKIIDLYTGGDTNLRLLLIEGIEKKVIYTKNKIYMYADSIVLGPTQDACIAWMKDPKNAKVVSLIRKDVYPDFYADEDEKVVKDGKPEAAKPEKKTK